MTKSLINRAILCKNVHLFSKEKKLAELQSGVVVEHFDIEKDCAWCGQRLSKGYRYSEYYEYNESMKNFNAKLIKGAIGGREAILIRFNFHGRCANEKHGRKVALMDE